MKAHQKKQKNRKKIILSTIRTVFTLLSCGRATFAWFTVFRPKADVGTVSGNLEYITIDRVSAYRYVYPFYEGSNVFIDYDKNPDGSDKGELKEFILQNEEERTVPSSINIDYKSNAPYCIVGDSVFNGGGGGRTSLRKKDGLFTWIPLPLLQSILLKMSSYRKELLLLSQRRIPLFCSLRLKQLPRTAFPRKTD